MEIKDLLRIIFRIFGLYSVFTLIFNFFPQQLTYLINSEIFFPFDSKNGIMQTWIYLIIVVILIFVVFYILIINPDIIISRLKPKKFLDEKINFEKLNSESLLQVAILAIGILLLFESIPELINKLFTLLKIRNMNQNISDDINTLGINSEIFSASFKVLVGLIFIIFQNGIGKMLYNQNVRK